MPLTTHLFLVICTILGLSMSITGKHHKNKDFHQQIHLSLGMNGTEMIVTWSTETNCNGAVVEYGKSSTHMNYRVKASSTEFKRNASFFTHRALLSNLVTDKVYHYRVGSDEEEFSDIYSFHTIPTGNKWNPKFLIYGDLGYKNDVSLKFLKKEFKNYDVIFHIGDLAYDLHNDFGDKGNKFMNEIQPVAANIPYMTCSGNHEKHDNFSHYDARFSMLGDRHNPKVKLPLERRLNNHYYSMDIGPAHIVVFSTEFYYFYSNYGSEQLIYQYEWLKNDLKKANHNRDKTPWIIAMGHRPFYTVKQCSEPECDAKNLERPAIRQGIVLNNETTKLEYGLEKLFYDMGVDIHISGHEHLYARLLPVYNYNVKPGIKNNKNLYQDALAPINIITGSAGNKEEHPKDREFSPSSSLPWVAHRNIDYGYTRMTFIDSLHISVEQTSDDRNGEVIDRFDIIKNSQHPKLFV